MALGDPDALRILVATDNHLGVHEKDQVRKDDAFITFREIFEIAKREKVDAVFLGGDLFDVNKPSRETMVRTMEILRVLLERRPRAARGAERPGRELPEVCPRKTSVSRVTRFPGA